MERLKGGIFITPKDIEIITGRSPKRARIEHQSIRDALGKKGKWLTVSEYCQYYELNLEEIISYINPYR